MATPTPPAPPVGPDTLVTIKILQNESVNRRLKIPLRDLGARVFPQKIRHLLAIPPHFTLTLERYSDSAACYVLLDSENPAVYKQLYRAAKAKLKLRIKATTSSPTTNEPQNKAPSPEVPSLQEPAQRYSYLDTVLSTPLPNALSPAAEASQPDQVISEESPQTQTPSHALPVSQENVTYALRFLENVATSGSFCIDCNNCGTGIPGEHYHCSICDDGDYDLCPTCVKAGVTCPGEGHWLLKRLVQNGVVMNSTTETLPPKRVQSENDSTASEIAPQKDEPEKEQKIEEKAVEAPVPEAIETGEERTCNACFREFSENKMVTCDDCEDYDLCVACLLKDAHGHHPAHNFSIIRDHQFCLKNVVQSRCRPGRHHHHAAICDGCDKRIIGVRHKCLTCPDWDYCWSCIKTVEQTHPRHRFVPIYESLVEPTPSSEAHYNIYCDGPLCRNKPAATCIVGVRYKCAVCHDTDFCAACEALPTNPHNRTHPLIKFQTSVRNVSISTFGDDGFGGRQVVMGDRNAPAMPPFTEAASTQTTVVDQSSVTEQPGDSEKSNEKGEQVEQTSEDDAPELQIKPEALEDPTTSASQTTSPVDEHDAYFMRDTIPDGTSMSPCHVFKQTWTLYNPGPLAWPVGTSVRYVGGDSMFNIDTNHPSSAGALMAAMSSNELTSPLEPSQSADFTVTLKSPQRTGTSISYWRLKLPNGIPFGHKLWCDIKVVEEIPDEDTVTPTTARSELSSTESNMIFPKLEKESPVSSTHEALSDAHDAAPPAPPLSSADEQEVLEDVESLTLEDVETDDDNGFLTDEEYDILDASDQESFNGKHA